MERKIGETFEFEGRRLKVKEDAKNACRNCYLSAKDCSKYIELVGECLGKERSDNKEVVFVIADELEEQPEEQAEQTQEEQQEAEQPKLNLCEVLKDCPKGEMFWSPVFDNVWFYDIDQYTKRVKVRTSGVASWYINADGTITIDKVTSPEIMLYPSRKQRDWSKFTAPWLKKERFDPKTLKPFDRVLCKNGLDIWRCDFFSSYMETYVCQNICISGSYSYCIPYNDETKYLIGTKDEAPDFYKYWED